jgi:hypothetical protein
MGAFRNWITARANQRPQGEDAHAAFREGADEMLGIPMGVFEGYQQNPHMILQALPGGYTAQIDPSPVTFARYNMSRGVHDVQLSNGWQRTNYGRRTVYASSGYLNEVAPEIPGQSRLIGKNTADFIMKGPAPAQWQNQVDQVQSVPPNPGGPGQLGGPLNITKGWGMNGARGLWLK